MELVIVAIVGLIAMTFIDRLLALFRAAMDKAWLAVLTVVLVGAIGYWALG
jgi:hypothetical protein